MPTMKPNRYQAFTHRILAAATLFVPVTLIAIHMVLIKGVAQRETAFSSITMAAAKASSDPALFTQWVEGEMTAAYSMVALMIVTSVLGLLALPIAIKLWRLGRQGTPDAHAQHTFGQVGGGIYKRIDENRELLELLRKEAPQLLEEHYEIEGWLRANDDFLVGISQVVSVPNARFHPNRVPAGTYPRPWPENAPSPASANSV